MLAVSRHSWINNHLIIFRSPWGFQYFVFCSDIEMFITWSLQNISIFVTIQVQVKSQKSKGLGVTLFCCCTTTQSQTLWLKLKIQFQNSLLDCDKVESNSSNNSNFIICCFQILHYNSRIYCYQGWRILVVIKLSSILLVEESNFHF